LMISKNSVTLFDFLAYLKRLINKQQLHQQRN